LVATSIGALPKKIRSGGLSASTTLRIALRVAVESPGLSDAEVAVAGVVDDDVELAEVVGGFSTWVREWLSDN
jgi:hypothetical protein